ncbi:MAG: hypothetical protein GY870_07320 [archaeon]|nr:hypothetical protein [archaeon]
MTFTAVSSVIISLLIIIDAKLLGGGKIFIYATVNGISGMRAGSFRIFTYVTMTVITYFYLLSTIKFNKKPIIKFLALVGWLIITCQLSFCNMTRQLLLVLFMSTVLFLFNIKAIFPKTIIWCTLGLGLLFAILISLNNKELVEKSTYYKLYERTKYESSKDEEGTIAVRIKGIKYFYPYFLQTSYIGMGMMSVNEPGNPISVAAKEHGFLFADLGFFSIIYRYGIFSIIAIVVILTLVFRDLLYIQKHGNIKYKIIASSFIYYYISKIIFLPISTIFFVEFYALYNGIIFYITYKLKSEIHLQDANKAAVLN